MGAMFKLKYYSGVTDCMIWQILTFKCNPFKRLLFENNVNAEIQKKLD